MEREAPKKKIDFSRFSKSPQPKTDEASSKVLKKRKSSSFTEKEKTKKSTSIDKEIEEIEDSSNAEKIKTEKNGLVIDFPQRSGFILIKTQPMLDELTSNEMERLETLYGEDQKTLQQSIFQKWQKYGFEDTVKDSFMYFISNSLRKSGLMLRYSFNPFAALIEAGDTFSFSFGKKKFAKTPVGLFAVLRNQYEHKNLKDSKNYISAYDFAEDPKMVKQTFSNSTSEGICFQKGESITLHVLKSTSEVIMRPQDTKQAMRDTLPGRLFYFYDSKMKKIGPEEKKVRFSYLVDQSVLNSVFSNPVQVFDLSGFETGKKSKTEISSQFFTEKADKVKYYTENDIGCFVNPGFLDNYNCELQVDYITTELNEQTGDYTLSPRLKIVFLKDIYVGDELLLHPESFRFGQETRYGPVKDFGNIKVFQQMPK